MRFLPMLFALFALVMSVPAGGPAAPAGGKTLRLLTVGNSFSVNATHYLSNLAMTAGDTLIHHPLVIGGSALDIHWVKAEKHEADPQDAAGLYSTGRSLRQELGAEKWDVVTIQQSSYKSADLATYRPFAQQLHDYIKKLAPGAEVVLHETWPYRVDDPRFTAPEMHETQADMFNGLQSSYRTIAKELGVRLLPVGDAFNMANTDPAWGYRPAPDVRNVQHPELPLQTHSLNKGYAWKADKDGVQKLGMDGHHANTAGEYLAACVWYEVLFGKSVVGNSFRPSGVNAEDAAYLQKTAHRAVEEDRARK